MKPRTGGPSGDGARADTVDLLGVPLDNLSRAEALERVAALVGARRPSLVVTPNVDHLVNLQADPEFRLIYARASLILADGVPLLWAARFLVKDSPELMAPQPRHCRFSIADCRFLQF